MALTDKLTAIGNAIRSKTGTTDQLTLDGMATAINGIVSYDIDGLTNKLTDITITTFSDDALKKLPGFWFQNFTKLVSVSCPAVTYIDQYIFNGCTALTTVNLPNLNQTSQYAFRNCTSLTSISLPQLEQCGFGLFNGCTKLETVSLPSLKQNISAYTFYNCSALKKVVLPRLIKVNSNDFYGCFSLTKVDFTDLVTIDADFLPTYSNTDTSRTGKLSALILRHPTVVTLSSATYIQNSALGYNCGYVYVPSALVSQYETATNWSSCKSLAAGGLYRAIEDYPDICGS